MDSGSRCRFEISPMAAATSPVDPHRLPYATSVLPMLSCLPVDDSWPGKVWLPGLRVVNGNKRPTECKNALTLRVRAF